VGLSVQERAELVGTFRWIELQLMRTLARWVPTTPEMEAKILFGRHIWDCARAADALGRRAFELRAPLHFTLPATDGYAALLAEAAATEATADRAAVLYDAWLPDLARRYEAYLGLTDTLMDEPTVRAIETALGDIVRMQRERTRLLAELDLPAPGDAPARLAARLAAMQEFVPHGHEAGRARGVRQ
jgi:hypothetical protein